MFGGTCETDVALRRIFDRIVKEAMMKMNEFVLTTEDTPQLAKGFKNVSRDVIIMLEDGKLIEGYYDYLKSQWRDDYSKKNKQTRHRLARQVMR